MFNDMTSRVRHFDKFLYFAKASYSTIREQFRGISVERPQEERRYAAGSDEGGEANGGD